MKTFPSISVFLLFAASLALHASGGKSLVLKSSSVVNGIVTLQGQVAGKDAELTCIAGHSLCAEPAPGEYVMARADANDGIYNDCTNVVLYKAPSAGVKEKVGVYCWLNSGDSYTPVQIETVKAHEYAAKGFHPIDCFAGQVRVRGKRLSWQRFTVFRPNAEAKCCGELVKGGRTDSHGHFVIEPLAEGEYFAQFTNKNEEYTVNFAIVQDYRRCEASHVELNFSAPNECAVDTYVDVDHDDKECSENDPACYRK